MLKQRLFAMNLQLFAADTGADGGAEVETTETQETATETTETPKTYTQEELEKILQAESDRKVSKALETSKAKWEAEYKQKLEAEKKEADRLAKLSAEEKQKALLEKQQSELSEKEKQIALREMKLESVKILSEKGLPVSFVDLLTTGDADSTKANIDTFDTAFKTALEIAVNERLKSSSVNPQVGVTTDLNTKLEEARKKAVATGKHEDRVAYANVKHEIEQQTKK